MLVNALLMGYSYVEVPLTHHERTYGQSKAVKPSNIVNAQLTILRLWWTLRVRGGVAERPAIVEESAPALGQEVGAGSAL